MYESSTRTSSPGSMLPTFIWKTFSRCCSSSAAVFPSRFAVSYSARAISFSRISGGDEAVTDTRAHRVYRRPGGRRKYIARLERDLPFVLVLLRDDDFRDHAEHANLDVRGLQRQRVDPGIRVFEGEVRTQGLVVGILAHRLGCSDPDDEDCEYCNHHPACFSDGRMLFSHVAESTRETAWSPREKRVRRLRDLREVPVKSHAAESIGSRNVQWRRGVDRCPGLLSHVQLGDLLDERESQTGALLAVMRTGEGIEPVEYASRRIVGNPGSFVPHGHVRLVVDSRDPISTRPPSGEKSSAFSTRFVIAPASSRGSPRSADLGFRP